MDEIRNKVTEAMKPMTDMFSAVPGTDQALAAMKTAVDRVETPKFLESGVAELSNHLNSGLGAMETKSIDLVSRVEGLTVALDETTQPLQRGIVEADSYRRKYPDFIIGSTAVAFAAPSLIRGPRFFGLLRGTFMGCVGAGAAAFGIEYLRICDKLRQQNEEG